jgi:hypothetical protein
MIVFADKGKWAFHTETTDSSGVLVKVDVTDMFRNDAGGGRGAKATKAGLAYVNSQGMWLITAIGQSNIPFSDQEYVATSLLGTSYFNDFDYSSSDIAYIAQKQTILLTGAKDSAKNNIILTYHTGSKAIGRFTGMNINRFMESNGTFYGTATNSNKVYTLFTGNDDDGNEIWTSYKQEVHTGGLVDNQSMLKQYCHGFLSPSTEITMSFDIYDYSGIFRPNKASLLWRTTNLSGSSDGYGAAAWSVSSMGGGSENAGLMEDFAGGSLRINNYQRLIVNFSEHSKLPHSISYFTIEAKANSQIRRRTLTQI